jgi:hypothetical protein
MKQIRKVRGSKKVIDHDRVYDKKPKMASSGSKMKKVYLGSSYKDVMIATKKPMSSIKIGESKSLIRYAKGSQEYVVPRKNVKLIRDN